MKSQRKGLLCALALAGCRHDDLDHVPYARPLSASPVFADGASARTPPDGTLSRETVGLPAIHGKSPLPFTAERLERGRELFNIHCAVCHGADGDGRGIVVRRGFPSPPSYHTDRLRQAPDSHFYDVISNGYGVMYPYRSQVAEADRWAITGYIRALQRSQNATLEDVADPDVRATLLKERGSQ